MFCSLLYTQHLRWCKWVWHSCRADLGRWGDFWASPLPRWMQLGRRVHSWTPQMSRGPREWWEDSPVPLRLAVRHVGKGSRPGAWQVLSQWQLKKNCIFWFERQKARNIYLLFYFFMHSLLDFVCALIGDQAINLGVLGRCSNQLNYLAKVSVLLLILFCCHIGGKIGKKGEGIHKCKLVVTK